MSPSLFRKSWLADESGNFTVPFAIALPVMCIMVGGTLSYSNSITLKAAVQAAADSAALAATTAEAQSLTTGNPMSASDAQDLARRFFIQNAPDAAVTAMTSFTAVTTAPDPGTGGTVSTTVNYSGVSTPLMGVSATSMPIDASATSSVDVASNAGNVSISGNGAEIWGDPHIIGANGDDFDVWTPPGQWTSIFSDSKLQINATGYNFGTMTVMEGFAISVAGHQIWVQAAGLVDPWNNPTGIDPNQPPGNIQPYWTGWIQVDGNVTNPGSPGNYVVLDDSADGMVVTDVVGAPSTPNSAANYVQITTPNYYITINFADSNTGEVTVGLRGQTSFTRNDVANGATNVLLIVNPSTGTESVCQIPGGMLGQTFNPTGNMDSSQYDFAMANGWSVSPQYSAPCTPANMVKHAKLTK